MDKDDTLERGAATVVGAAIDAVVGAPLSAGLRGISQLGAGVRAWHFERKANAFLDELGTAPTRERLRLLDNLEADPDRREHLMVLIITELDRIDSEEKARLLWRAVWWYLSGGRTEAELRAFVATIERCLVADIEQLSPGDAPVAYPADVGTRLSGCGLVEIATIPQIRGGGSAGSWSLTRFGRDFYYAVVRSGEE